jgi:serine protease DegS
VTPRAASAYREEFRPLTPYLLGRNRVAGAEVVDLRPELAQYFGVEGGILVVDVPDLTPAGMAGLRPGDVVTRLGREPVRSVEELRLAVSSAGRTVPLTLIRQGASIEVLLRR